MIHRQRWSPKVNRVNATLLESIQLPRGFFFFALQTVSIFLSDGPLLFTKRKQITYCVLITTKYLAAFQAGHPPSQSIKCQKEEAHWHSLVCGRQKSHHTHTVSNWFGPYILCQNFQVCFFVLLLAYHFKGQFERKIKVSEVILLH